MGKLAKTKHGAFARYAVMTKTQRRQYAFENSMIALAGRCHVCHCFAAVHILSDGNAVCRTHRKHCGPPHSAMAQTLARRELLRTFAARRQEWLALPPDERPRRPKRPRVERVRLAPEDYAWIKKQESERRRGIARPGGTQPPSRKKAVPVDRFVAEQIATDEQCPRCLCPISIHQGAPGTGAATCPACRTACGWLVTLVT